MSKTTNLNITNLIVLGNGKELKNEKIAETVTNVLSEVMKSANFEESFNQVKNTQNNIEKVSFSRSKPQKKTLVNQYKPLPAEEKYKELRKEEITAIVESLDAETYLMKVALEHCLYSKKCHSHQSETERVMELESYLTQMYSFQMNVSQQILPLLKFLHNSKTE